MEVSMRSKLVTLVLSAVVVGFPMVASVHAQSPSPAAPTKAEPPAAPVAGHIPLGVSVQESQLVATGWRVSKLMHADIRNERGDKVGKVDDILVASDGSLSTAIIDVGGFLGMGEHRVAIPVQQFSMGEKNRITLPGATKDSLKQLPEFEYSK
jgi:sporulation protein YlmC with PRC-barrel domain